MCENDILRYEQQVGCKYGVLIQLVIQIEVGNCKGYSVKYCHIVVLTCPELSFLRESGFQFTEFVDQDLRYFVLCHPTELTEYFSNCIP